MARSSGAAVPAQPAPGAPAGSPCAAGSYRAAPARPTRAPDAAPVNVTQRALSVNQRELFASPSASSSRHPGKLTCCAYSCVYSELCACWLMGSFGAPRGTMSPPPPSGAVLFIASSCCSEVARDDSCKRARVVSGTSRLSTGLEGQLKLILCLVDWLVDF